MDSTPPKEKNGNDKWRQCGLVEEGSSILYYTHSQQQQEKLFGG